MVNDYLEHYGVPGMKWGVRRYQNTDGTLTAEGRQRAGDIRRVRSAAKTKGDVDRIVNTLNDKQKNFLGMQSDEKEYLTMQQGEYVLKRFLAKDGDKAVGFFDILNETPHESKGTINLAMAVDSNYQGKNYGARLAKQGSDWIRKHQDEFSSVTWAAKPDNYGSRHLAEKNGWKLSSERSDKKWAVYNP